MSQMKKYNDVVKKRKHNPLGCWIRRRKKERKKEGLIKKLID